MFNVLIMSALRNFVLEITSKSLNLQPYFNHESFDFIPKKVKS